MVRGTGTGSSWTMHPAPLKGSGVLVPVISRSFGSVECVCVCVCVGVGGRVGETLVPAEGRSSLLCTCFCC